MQQHEIVNTCHCAVLVFMAYKKLRPQCAECKIKMSVVFLGLLYAKFTLCPDIVSLEILCGAEKLRLANVLFMFQLVE